MLQRLLNRNAKIRVESQHSLKEIHGLLRSTWEQSCQICLFKRWEDFDVVYGGLISYERRIVEIGLPQFI